MKVFDCHSDLFTHFTVRRKLGETDVFKKYHLHNFNKGSVKFGVFNVWIDDESMCPRKRFDEIMAYGLKEVYDSNYLKMIYKYDDFNINSDSVQFILGLEGIDYLESPKELYTMYQLGVRLVSLTWNNNNRFATSITSKIDNGLTNEGKEAISIMNDLGIVVDVSHLSDKSAKEIIQLSKSPVIASHSNARIICNHPRNLSTELIKMIAASNGVIGINSYTEMVSTNKSEQNLDTLINHIDYIRDLVGIDYIALGFDFMDYLIEDSPSQFLNDITFMKDLKNQSDVQMLVEKLKNGGYNKEEIEKICYKNILRVLKHVLKGEKNYD